MKYVSETGKKIVLLIKVLFLTLNDIFVLIYFFYFCININSNSAESKKQWSQALTLQTKDGRSDSIKKIWLWIIRQWSTHWIVKSHAQLNNAVIHVARKIFSWNNKQSREFPFLVYLFSLFLSSYSVNTISCLTDGKHVFDLCVCMRFI